ncbi:MAG: zinc-dependent alcohol dehydrogenase family protein [Ilumatobacteraceae bacterium]
MRAVMYTSFEGPPSVEDVPEPICAVDGAVIRVEATGLCRSDWHGWMGHDPDIDQLPHVPGHELAGTIAEIGHDVRGWHAGDRVTVPFVLGCGHCEPCTNGDQQICDNQLQPGFTQWGSFAELVHIPRAEINLVRLPDQMDFVTAASLGCRFATSYRAVVQQGRVANGEWVAVHGCGGIGLSAIMIARSFGANVIAIDVSPSALEAARAAGADHTLDARDIDGVANAIKEITGGGAHLSIDGFGSEATCINSITCLRKRGRHVQVGLMVGTDAHPGIPMGLVIGRELEVRGSHGMSAHEYPAMLAAVVDGTLRPDSLVGRTISLDDAPAALMAMSNPTTSPGMTVILPGSTRN